MRAEAKTDVGVNHTMTQPWLAQWALRSCDLGIVESKGTVDGVQRDIGEPTIAHALLSGLRSLPAQTEVGVATTGDRFWTEVSGWPSFWVPPPAVAGGETWAGSGRQCSDKELRERTIRVVEGEGAVGDL